MPVLVDVDVAGRTGVDGEEQAIEIARAATCPGTRFVGICRATRGTFSTWRIRTLRRAGAFEAYERLASYKDALERAGFEVQQVSVAGTGTYRFALEHGTANRGSGWLVRFPRQPLLDCSKTSASKTPYSSPPA